MNRTSLTLLGFITGTFGVMGCQPSDTVVGSNVTNSAGASGASTTRIGKGGNPNAGGASTTSGRGGSAEPTNQGGSSAVGATGGAAAGGAGQGGSSWVCSPPKTPLVWAYEGGMAQPWYMLLDSQGFHHSSEYVRDTQNLAYDCEVKPFDCDQWGTEWQYIASRLAAVTRLTEGATAPVLLGRDLRAADGPVTAIQMDGRILHVGLPCEGASGCLEIPAEISELMTALEELRRRIFSTRCGGRCQSAADCQLSRGCCGCEAVGSGEVTADCARTCAVTACEEAGFRASDVACVAGRCVLDRSCAGTVTCKMMEPQCSSGQVPSIIDGCYGPCIPVSECKAAPSCAACGAAGLACVTDVTMLGPVYHCVNVSAACKSNPTCSCMGVCGSPYECSQPDSTTLTCSCPAC